LITRRGGRAHQWRRAFRRALDELVAVHESRETSAVSKVIVTPECVAGVVIVWVV
jgi:hypothetical protein